VHILNLTQHEATGDQEADGVVDLPADARTELVKLLTFDSAPTKREKHMRAKALAELALLWAKTMPEFDLGLHKVMIGGAPFFMSALEWEMEQYGIQPVYAFSHRVSVEQVLPDGSVRKVKVFRHEGFVS